MTIQTFFGRLAVGVRCALEPIANAFHSTDGVRDLLRSLGWDAEVTQATFLRVRASMAALETLFLHIQTLANQIEAGAADELAIARQLIDGMGSLFQIVKAFATPPATPLAFPFDQPALWSQAGSELIDLMVLQFLEVQTPAAYAALLFTGVAELTPTTPTGSGRIPYLRHAIRWDRLGDVVTDPVGLLKQLYHWDDGRPFDHPRLLLTLERAFGALRLPTRQTEARAALATRYFAPGNPALPALRALDVPVFSIGSGTAAHTEFGVTLLPVPPAGTPGAAPVGLAISPLALGTLGAGIATGSPFTVTVGAGFAREDAFAIEIRPDGVALHAEPGVTRIDAELALAGRPPQPWILFGDPHTHRVEVGGLYAGMRVNGPVDGPEVVIEVGTGRGPTPPKLALVIQMAESDGFLRQILGDEPQRLEAAGTLRWSSKTGFAIAGSAGIRMVLPVDLRLGPASLDEVVIAIAAGGGGLDATLAVSGGFALGPLSVRVEEIGLRLGMHAPPAGRAGTAGPIDLSFGFKPPSGLGIAIDAGPVTGGGFLDFHSDEGRYDGIMQLQILAVQVTAIGLLDTRVDGAPFAFLVVIDAEFPDIQLGFGFTLKGLGGALGVHRTIATDVLQAGLRAHTLDSILFPHDAIAHATQVISDLRRVFPPAAGRYVFGPIAKLGWGTPTLIEAEIGLILEVPDPIRLVLLGQISAALPSKAAAIVEIHVDVLGVLDLGRKSLAIDASLHDSRVALFALYGDLALRLSWGDPPSFAFSLGGLHPAFQPPPDFPALRRLTVALGVDDNPRITLQSYLALTSNTVQFGARAELYAAAAGFHIYGWIGFDVLVIFSPFSFRADFSAGIALRRGTSTIAGIRVNGTLTGPTPFHAWGEACLSLLFFDICVGFDAQFGEHRDELLDAQPVWPALAAAIGDQRSWSVRLPSRRVVSLTEPADGAPPLVDPVGVLELHEKVAPLNRPITRFGETRPSDIDKLDVTEVGLGTGTHRRTVGFIATQDDFAPAQFRDMSDDDKLSSPSFEAMDSGVAVISADLANGPAIGADLVYETKIIDAPDHPARTVGVYRPSLGAVLAQLETGALARSSFLNSGALRFAPPPGPPIARLDDVRYVVVSNRDLTMRRDVLGAAASHGAALAALDAHLDAHPAERGQLDLVPIHEAEAA
jgi:hypothetical protein